MKSFLLANSDRKFDNTWYKDGELNSVSKAVNDYAFGNNKDASGILTDNNTFYAVKVLESANVPEQIGRAHV